MSKPIPCKYCGSTPARTMIPFIGQSYAYECRKCGISSPFPPAKTPEAALDEWNADNSESGGAGDQS